MRATSRRHALSLRRFEVGRDIVAVAWIIARIDDFEIGVWLNRQAEALDSVLDHVRTADQDRFGQPLLQHHLRRPQHALVLAFGIDDRLHRRPRLGEHRLHDEARAEDEAIELIGVGVEIGDRPAGDAALHCRARDRRRDAQHQPRVEWVWNQRTLAEQRRLAVVGLRRDFGGRLARQRRNRGDRGLLHCFVDLARADVEGAAEHVREAENVVDLVRIVGASGADHGVRPRRQRQFRHDLGRRICERHHQGVLRHLLEHLGLQHPADRQAEENIGVGNNFGEGARAAFARIDRLPAIHQCLAALIDHAFDVADDDVLALARRARRED